MALGDACNTLLMFRAAAEAAGDTLNQDTWLEGLESLTEIELIGGPGSFGPGKYAAQDAFWLYEPNPAHLGPGQGTEAILPISDEPFVVGEG